MGRNNQDLGEHRFDVDRHDRPPTLSEYATAKKDMEIHVDPASPDGDKTVISIVVEAGVDVLLTSETLLNLYWRLIPDDQKRKIKVGDSHQTN